MLHKSSFEHFSGRFPHDTKGNVPVHRDHWHEMEYDHGDMDPNELGISDEEKARRIEYLNTEWWPKILEQVEEERQRLAHQHGETFMEHWKSVTHIDPEGHQGFEIA